SPAAALQGSALNQKTHFAMLRDSRGGLTQTVRGTWTLCFPQGRGHSGERPRRPRPCGQES
ncbi:hypothetical protein CSUI_010223, partial [Cystoisospora suis]